MSRSSARNAARWCSGWRRQFFGLGSRSPARTRRSSTTRSRILLPPFSLLPPLVRFALRVELGCDRIDGCPFWARGPSGGIPGRLLTLLGRSPPVLHHLGQPVLEGLLG